MPTLILQNRDIQILRFMEKFSYCKEGQIASLCAISKISASKATNRLMKAGYLLKQRIFANEDVYIFLGKLGAEFLALKPVKKLILNTLEHDTLLIDLYFILAKQYTDSNFTIKTDKELKQLRNISENSRIPDLLINDSIAIELEITEKSKARLQQIVNSYIVNEDITEVHYYVYDQILAKKIHQLSSLNSKFKFYILNKIDSCLSFNELNLNEVNNNEKITVNSNLANNKANHFGDFIF